jgi:hypothetical protein
VIAIALTIAAAVWVGIATEHRYGPRAVRWSKLALSGIIYVAVPVIVFFNVARLQFDVDVAGGLALAWLNLAVAGGLAFVVATRLLSLDRPQTGAVMACVMQANTGYVGIPLVAVFFGTDAIGQGAAYDAVVTGSMLFLGVFGVGAAFGTQAGEGWRERARSFLLNNPPLVAVIAALLAPDSIAPDRIVDATHLLIFALIPLGFFAVGVTLAAESDEGDVPFPPPLSRPVVAALSLRLFVAPALLFAIALPLIDIPHPYLLQAAMPCGINALVVAHLYGLDLKITAGAIAWSTALVVAVGVVASIAGV